jgi:hypothetical protein
MAALALATLLGGAGACTESGSTDQGAATGGGRDAAVATSMPSSPAAWCMRSPEPNRCRARSGVEHEMCKGNPASYDSCRFAMDQMHGP